MTDMKMNRRDFLGSIMASLVLSAGALTLLAGRSLGSEAAVPNGVFYDERFPQAARLAKRIAGPAQTIAVRGDVTPVWNQSLKSAGRHSPLLLAGVTTESFYFCLKNLLRTPAGAQLTSRRISRDLYAWSIYARQPISRRKA
jgi:hypothetical protein